MNIFNKVKTQKGGETLSGSHLLFNPSLCFPIQD